MSIELILGAIFANLSVTNKPEIKFFTELFELIFSIHGKLNFENLSRYSFYNECTFRRRFSQFFDWLSFNATLIKSAQVGSQGAVIAAIDCSFISKSGKKTFGLDKFWSGCANVSKKGLEISVLALIDVTTAAAWTLDVTQTPAQLKKDGAAIYTRIDFYLEQIFDALPHLSQVKYIVADGYYAKVKVVKGLLSVDKHLITRLRSDANLRFRFEGEHEKRPGPKSIYDGKAVYDDLSKWHFKGNDAKYDHLSVYHRICHSTQMECWLSVILVLNTKTNKYVLLASTDVEQDTLQILTYYQLRFKIEFLFRDAKQFAGLNHCQARDEDKLDFHFNMSLTAINIIQLLKINNPKVKSLNKMTRTAYNTRIVQNLLDQLSLNAEFDISNPLVAKVINLGAEF
jgi:DDE superfamily endonuclease